MIYKDMGKIIFNFLIKHKLTPYDIQYENGYFIFEFGNDTVCNFKIKGCKNWQFGIWFDTDQDDYNKVGEIFAQYIPYIDKFKPSRSYYCERIDRCNIDEFKNNRYRWHPIIDMITEIKKYKYVSRYYDLTNGDRYITRYGAFKYCLIYDLEDFYKKFKEKIIIQYELFVIKIKLLRLKFKDKRIYEYKIIDKNTKEISCYPRFEIDIVFYNNSILDKELKKFDDKLRSELYDLKLKNISEYINYFDDDEHYLK